MQIVSLSSPYPLKAFQVAMIQPAYWPRVDLQELYRCAVWSGQGAPSIDFHLLPSNVMRVDQGAKWAFRFQRCRMADNIIILPLILIDIFLSLGNLFIEILVVVAAVADAFLMRSNSWLPRANIPSFFFLLLDSVWRSGVGVGCNGGAKPLLAHLMTPPATWLLSE